MTFRLKCLCDDGLTGTDDTRASFMRVITDIEDGKVNCVVCKTLSRAFRNYSDQGYYLEYYFPQKNVRFISTGDPKIDTFTNPEAITGLEVPITGLMNDRYSAKTSSDIRRTFDHKRRNGEFIGAFAPYGYLKDPNDKNHLILDDEIVPIKRDILLWFIRDGMSLRGIAKRLNDMGILNPTAHKRSCGLSYCNPSAEVIDGLWTGGSVKRVLTDRMNLGHMVQGKQRVVSYKVHDRVTTRSDEWFVKENTHEATYTQEEFDTVQRLLRRDTRTANGKREVYLFSGFLRCHDCDHALQRKTAHDIVYYSCRTYAEKSKERCTKHSIREDILYQAVLTAIQFQIAQLECLTDVVDQLDQMSAMDTQVRRLEKLLTEKRRELEKARHLGDGLYGDWKSGLMTQDAFVRRSAKYSEQETQLCETIANLKDEHRRATQVVTSESHMFADFLKHKNLQQLDRSVLTELVQTIYVHEGKTITIVFQLEDELQRLMKLVEMDGSTA
ncbi:MAG: recombinase family protein [Oscillospiraceae bacterium]|nr:recombinase family protein [Oscillospiraceae bacterium]